MGERLDLTIFATDALRHVSAASRRQFVIRHAALARTAEPPLSLAGLATLKPLPSGQGGWVAEMTHAAPARAAWQALQAQLGAGFLVLPVLEDNDGGQRFPTGRISVRFRAPVTDARLHALAQSCSLALAHRTKFTDRQAVFDPGDAAADYLPDLVARLETVDDVDSAWLDAESAYLRAK